MDKKHIPALDGLRGIAILLVLFTHISKFNGTPIFAVNKFSRLIFAPMVFGWSGVDLFFVLSGFLITGILIETKPAVNRALSFYARRFLRIFPLYYGALIVVFSLAATWPWLNSALASGFWNRAVFFLYLQNSAPFWGGGSPVRSIIGHFWSLAVEEQFYLIWPMVVWSVSRNALLRMCIAGSACALIFRVILVAHFGAQHWISLLTPSRGEGLLVGSALAILTSQRGRIPVKILSAMAVGGALLIGSIVLLDHKEFTNTDAGPYMYTTGITGLALFFGALVGSSQYEIPFLTPFLRSGWLRSFGKYSYGIYVFHGPVYALARYGVSSGLGILPPFEPLFALSYVLIAIAISYAVAWVSYQCFEKWFLRMKGRFEPVYAPGQKSAASYSRSSTIVAPAPPSLGEA